MNAERREANFKKRSKEIRSSLNSMKQHVGRIENGLRAVDIWLTQMEKFDWRKADTFDKRVLINAMFEIRAISREIELCVESVHKQAIELEQDADMSKE